MEYELIRHLEGTDFKIFVVSINQRECHYHSDMEIFLTLNGPIRVEISNERHLFHTDDIFIANRYDIHSLSRVNENNLALVIQFNPGIFSSYFDRITRIRFTRHHLSQAEDYEYHGAIKQSLTDMIQCYLNKSDGYHLEMMSILNHMLYVMIHNDEYTELSEKDILSKNRNMGRLVSVLDFIRLHYMDNITLRSIAERENLDMYYLSAFIKKHLGIPFQKYLTHLRTEKAAQLLRNTGLSLMDICMESGFSDYKYLNKAILAEYGCTPAEYRKRNHQDSKFLPEQNEQHVIIDDSRAKKILKTYFDID